MHGMQAYRLRNVQSLKTRQLCRDCCLINIKFFRHLCWAGSQEDYPIMAGSTTTTHSDYRPIVWAADTLDYLKRTLLLPTL